MLTVALTAIIAFYNHPIVTGLFAWIRPVLGYLLGFVFVCLAFYFGKMYFERIGQNLERQRIQSEVKERIQRDNTQVEADRARLDAEIARIRAENELLRKKIDTLPTPKQVIAHPKAAEKQYNDAMSGQFKRFEEITK